MLSRVLEAGHKEIGLVARDMDQVARRSMGRGENIVLCVYILADSRNSFIQMLSLESARSQLQGQQPMDFESFRHWICSVSDLEIPSVFGRLGGAVATSLPGMVHRCLGREVKINPGGHANLRSHCVFITIVCASFLVFFETGRCTEYSSLCSGVLQEPNLSREVPLAACGPLFPSRHEASLSRVRKNAQCPVAPTPEI